MDAKICDRCGKVYGNSNTTIIVPTDKYPDVGRISLYTHNGGNAVDLCDECAEELRKWLEVAK